MSKTQIEKKMEKENIKFRVATQIREMLDAARREYGVAEWDESDNEQEIQEMVFEEGNNIRDNSPEQEYG